MMRRSVLAFITTIALTNTVGLAQQPASGGPYKVLKTAKVGGEGGTDYIFADSVGRRLYITRGATRAIPATDTAPAVPAFEKRVTIFDLDTLELVGVVAGVGGNGAIVCGGNGFTSDHPQPSMFDLKTFKLIRSIDVPAPATADAPAFSADGIYCDTFSNRVYIGSHPTKALLVVDAKTGATLGNIDLGGTPEQSIGDGKGTIYQVLQERPGSVAVVDTKTMKVMANYPFVENGGCNGLALDVKNSILFASCATGTTTPPQTMVILSAKDGKILARLPLAGSSDGAMFNPATMEVFSSQSNGTMTIVKETNPTTFEVEQNLQTMTGARTVAFDSKTGHLFVMAAERGPAPPPPPGGGRGGGAPVIPGSFSVLMIGR